MSKLEHNSQHHKSNGHLLRHLYINQLKKQSRYEHKQPKVKRNKILLIITIIVILIIGTYYIIF